MVSSIQGNPAGRPGPSSNVPEPNGPPKGLESLDGFGKNPSERRREQKFREHMRSEKEGGSKPSDLGKMEAQPLDPEAHSSSADLPAATQSLEDVLAAMRKGLSESSGSTEKSKSETQTSDTDDALDQLDMESSEGENAASVVITQFGSQGVPLDLRSPHSIDSVGEVGSVAGTDPGVIIDELADRILVSDPKSANPEIRIEVNPELLPDTSITIRYESGELKIAIVSDNPEVTAFLTKEEANLESRLNDALDVTVDVQVEGGAGEGILQTEDAGGASNLNENESNRSDDQSSDRQPGGEQGSADDSDTDDREQSKSQDEHDDDDLEW